MAGFDRSGAVICRAPGSTEPIPPGWIPIPLAQGEQVETYLENLSGTEINRSTPFQFSVPFVGTVHGSFNMLGFALYEPADPLAAPGVTPPIFGCVPTVGVTFVADSPSEATLTVNAGAIFAAFGGNWDAPFPLGSGPIQGYVLLEGVTIQLGVALVDAEEGQKRFGAVTTRALQWQTRTIDITFGNSLVDGVAGLAINLATSSLIADVRGLAAASVETALASMPPFVLQPNVHPRFSLRGLVPFDVPGSAAAAARSSLAGPLEGPSHNPASLAFNQHEFDVEVFYIDDLTCSEGDKFIHGQCFSRERRARRRRVVWPIRYHEFKRSGLRLGGPFVGEPELRRHDSSRFRAERQDQGVIPDRPFDSGAKHQPVLAD